MRWLKLLLLSAAIILVVWIGCKEGGGRARQLINGGTRAASTAQPPLLRDDADSAEFVSGTTPSDTDGQPIYAHEGHIITQDDGLLLWYGTGQKHLEGDDWLSDSIRLYTSRDFSNWRSKGRVFLTSSIPQLPAPPPYRIGSVNALYNAVRRQYVLIFSVSSLDRSFSAIGFATSVAPSGPFKWERASVSDGAPTSDVAVAWDEDGGGASAYLVRSTGANGTTISRLRDDFLGTTGACGYAPPTGAPALFKSGGRWYLFGSRHKGWQPGAPQLFASDSGDLCGATWSKLPRPADGRGADTTFDSQPAFVHTFRWQGGGELQIYAGDRWNAEGEGGVGNASYVFLPLLPAGDGGDPPGFELQWLERWRLGDYKPITPS